MVNVDDSLALGSLCITESERAESYSPLLYSPLARLSHRLPPPHQPTTHTLGQQAVSHWLTRPASAPSLRHCCRHRRALLWWSLYRKCSTRGHSLHNLIFLLMRDYSLLLLRYTLLASLFFNWLDCAVLGNQLVLHNSKQLKNQLFALILFMK